MKRRVLDENTRFCIVGAGVAGLTVARALRGRGYKNLTIFEKEEIAGGKARTLFYQGRAYELGTSLIDPDDHITLSVMKELGVKPTPRLMKQHILNLDAIEVQGLDKLGNKLRALGELIRFAYQAFNNRKIYRSGFVDIPEDLYQSFHDYCYKNRFPLLEELFNLFFPTAGYGYADMVPAAYYFKFITPTSISIALTKRSTRYPKDAGAGTIWQKLAEKFDVRFQQNIMTIKRDESIKLQTQKDTFEFDKLILACPLDNALRFLDATLEEKELFSKIEHYDYYVSICLIDGLPVGSSIIPKSYLREDRGDGGELVHAFHLHKDINPCQYYVLAHKYQDEQEIEQMVAKKLESVGATVGEKIASARWKYFPHVSSETMRNGFYERLENLQGANHTYMVGEVMNFSCVRTVARYSYDLVERFF